MSAPLRENSITIRGKLYLVRELDAKTMATVRKMIDSEKWRVEAFVIIAEALPN